MMSDELAVLIVRGPWGTAVIVVSTLVLLQLSIVHFPGLSMSLVSRGVRRVVLASASLLLFSNCLFGVLLSHLQDGNARTS
jgi:hypothetical protein